MRPLVRPLHLLELGEALAHDLIHHRFHESRRDRFLVSPELAVVSFRYTRRNENFVLVTFVAVATTA